MMRWLREWWPFVLGALVCAVAALFAVREDARRSAAWERFKIDRHCRLVATADSTESVGSGIGFDSKGNVVPTTVVVSSPGRESWLCDDGVVHTK